MYADKQIKLDSFHIQEPNKIVELNTTHFGFKIHQKEILPFPLQTKKYMPRPSYKRLDQQKLKYLYR